MVKCGNIVTGTGRENPMLLITNDFDTTPKEIIETYALRWLIENNIQENVDFFSLNALSSPIIVKVDFDIAMTLVANTLYKILAGKFTTRFTKYWPENSNSSKKPNPKQFTEISLGELPKYILAPIQLGLYSVKNHLIR
jgi:hypothetical protein